MSSMSLTFSGSIIGISYGEMNSVKSNLRRASDMLQQSQSKINSAKTKVQVDRSSSRLRLSEEQISTIYTNAAKQKTKIDKLCNNIDITIRKFKEVDARCAARIRSISKSYDKSKSLWNRIKSAVSSFSSFAMNSFKSLIDMGNEALSALGQKVSEGFNAVSEWMDKHPVVVNIVTGTLDALAIATTAVAIVAGTVTGVGIVVAVVGAVYAASTLIDSGVKIYNNIKNGTNSGFNFIEEGFKKVMGDTAGEMAFGVTNLIALAVNLPSMAKGALKLGTGAINFFKEGEGIAKIGASLSSIGENISNFLEEGKAAFKTLGEVSTNKISDFLESVKHVKNNIGKTLEEIKVNIENIGPKLAYEVKGDATNHYKFDVIDNRITSTSDNYKFSDVDEIEDVVKGENKTKRILDEKLEKYICDSFEGVGKEAQDNFNKYLRENVWCDETLSNAEKIEIMEANFDKLTPEQKINFNVSNEVKVLKNTDYSNWGEWPDIDWPDFPGLSKDTAKSVYNEATGKIEIPNDLDRLGSPYGNNLGVVEDGYHCTQNERSICYIENEYARNSYKFDETYYKDAIDIIKDFDMSNPSESVDKINNIIDKLNVKYKINNPHIEDGDILFWNKDYNAFQNEPKLIELCSEKGIGSTYGVIGEAEKWMVNGELIASGGSGQINIPIKVKALEDIGILRNIGGW